MKKFRKAILFAFLSPLLLHASYILKNDTLHNPKAIKLIETMGDELVQKTGVHAYILTTNEAFEVGANLVEYAKQFEEKMDRPYVLYLFAPKAKITEKTEITGRVGIIPSSSELKKLYDYNAVRDAGLDVITVKDKNSIDDKQTIGLVQAYSELADNIADAKGVKMTTTIKNDTRTFIRWFKVILYLGLALVVWIYFLRPLIFRRKS
jgi:hypothetical protein